MIMDDLIKIGEELKKENDEEERKLVEKKRLQMIMLV